MKTETEFRASSVVNPREWVSANASRFEALIHAWRSKYMKTEGRLDPGKTTRSLDFSYRTLSEMPLCMSQGELLGVSHGMYLSEALSFVLRGRVHLTDPMYGSERSAPHRFIHALKSDTIIDFTVAQFVKEGDKPGVRLEAIHTLAPDLFVDVSEGFAALVGTRDEILQRLGISYSAQSRLFQR